MKQNHINKISDKQLILEYTNTPHLGKLSVKFKLPIITIWRRLNKLNIKIKTVKNNVKIPIQEILNGMHPYYQTFKLNKRLLKEKIFSIFIIFFSFIINSYRNILKIFII